MTDAALEKQSHSLALTLLNFKNGGLGEFVKGKTIKLAIEGSRRFRPPGALGLMRYEGCLIIVFEPAARLDGAAFMKTAVTSAVRVEESNGTKIAVFEEQSENDTWTTFVGFPRIDVAVVATNLDYLHTLLDRMHGATTKRAVPQELAEWKHVDTTAPVWGLRHFRKQDVDADPSSPLRGEDASNTPDPQAVGVTFSFRHAAERKAAVDYLSGDRDARRILSELLMFEDADTASPREFQMRLRQPAAGVLEAVINLGATEAVFKLRFAIMAILGHAVYF
jgi:hypothetical protein